MGAFFLLTGVVQTSLKLLTNPFSTDEEMLGYPWYLPFVAGLVFILPIWFLVHVGKQLAVGLKQDTRNSAARWVETETFPTGLKGKVMKKFSETTKFDRLICFIAGRKATYGTWEPISDSPVDKARFLAFKKRYNTQYGKFRGERRTRYTFYVFEAIAKIMLMFLLAALIRYPQTQVRILGVN